MLLYNCIPATQAHNARDTRPFNFFERVGYARLNRHEPRLLHACNFSHLTHAQLAEFIRIQGIHMFLSPNCSCMYMAHAEQLFFVS